MIFSDCIKVNESLYAFSMKKNLLLKININKRDISVIGSIPKEAFDSRRLVSKLLSFEDKILMIPYDASDIWIYTLNTREWTQIKFEEPNLILKFTTGFIYLDKAYMIGGMYAGIAIYDFKTRELKYFKNIHDIWKRNQMTDIFCRDYAFLGASKILIPSCRSNEIAELNLETLEIMMHKVGDTANTYESICIVDGHCWITPRKGNKIIIWNMENEIRPLDAEIGVDKNIYRYCGVTAYSNQVFLFASNGAISYICGLLGNIIRTTDDNFLFLHKDKDNAVAQTKDEVIWIIEDNIIKKIDTKDISIERLFAMGKDRFYEEDGSYSLSGYLDFIKGL